jgi:hypothetical protein
MAVHVWLARAASGQLSLPLTGVDEHEVASGRQIRAARVVRFFIE